MKTSIVLSTFNGNAYIIEQLESIKNQIIPADEVLIFDDASTDNTFEIVKNYIKENNLKGWYAVRNIENLGWRKNFITGMDQASGNYIFLCDQDDIWKPDKLSDMILAMDENPEIDLLASTYIQMFEIDGKERKFSEYKYDSDDLISKYSMPLNILNVPFPGCVYCVRKSFYNSIRKFWIETCPHDCLLWRSAVLKGSAYIYNKPLIMWRKHIDSAFTQEINTVNVTSEVTWREREKNELYKLLEYIDEELSCFDVKPIVERNLQWVLTREEWLKNKRIKNVFLLMKYINLYNSFKEFVRDIYIGFFEREGADILN